VTVTYVADAVSGDAQLPPAGASSDPVLEGDANASEIPIDQLAGVYRNADGVAVVGGNSKPGVEAYLSAQPTHSYTFWAEVAPAAYTEALIIKNVGKRQAPAGIASPTSDKWLKTGRRVRTAGKASDGDLLLEITEQYQYNAAGWDTDIYAAGSGGEGAV
jgi:hypothetical protein